MRVFIDFEASSLSNHSYPIEVGWVFEDGRSEAHLIAPAADWTDWNPAAEAIHRLTRDKLVADGTPHELVAQRVAECMAGHDVLASAPSWDGKWLSRLLRAAGLPRRAVTLRDTDEARAELAAALLAPIVPSGHIHRLVRQLLAKADAPFLDMPPAHRALADARRERERWRAVEDLVHAHAAAIERGEISP